MESKKHTPKYTAEFRERGVRLYREQRPDYTSDNAAYRAIASKLGCSLRIPRHVATCSTRMWPVIP